MIVLGDSLQLMAAMRPDSIDAIVTDPPYALGFMNRAWDTHRTPRAFQEWSEGWAAGAMRALKPGGYLIAFASPRTFHRAWSGIEDAGFEIRDTLCWLYGSGFPKSLDVSKAIDSGLGVTREAPALVGTTGDVYGEGINVNFRERPRSLPVTEEARARDGWGTALKPGWEPICLARKPFDGPLYRNVLEWGTGALNIPATRLERLPGDRTEYGVDGDEASRPGFNGYGANVYEADQGGRWPANVILTHSPECEPVGTRRVKSRSPAVPNPEPNGEGGQTYGFRFGKGRASRGLDFRFTDGTTGYADEDGLETVEAWECEEGCPVRQLDEQSGVSASVGGRPAQVGLQTMRGAVKAVLDCSPGYGDVGGASRFFYTAKASRAEREAWGRIKADPRRRSDGRAKDIENPRLRTSARVNHHPTVKPLELMAWLVRLVAPPGGLVLDPFAGSGTTLVAARREGFQCMGIEMDPDSAYIARERLRAQWEVKLL